MKENKIIIYGNITENDFYFAQKPAMNNLTIKTEDGICYYAKVSGEHCGMIAIGEKIKVTGDLNNDTNEIYNAKFELLEK